LNTIRKRIENLTEEERFVRAAWQIMEALLETERLKDALSEALKSIVNTRNITKET
jgi:threonine synthase